MPERINPTDTDWWPEYGWEHLQRYAFAAKYCRSGKVLDFGCGVGYGTGILARSGAEVIVGVDTSVAAIRTAKQRLIPSNVHFEIDLEHMKHYAPEGFEFAVMFEVIEHLQNPQATLKQLADILKSGALLIISAPNRHRFSEAAKPIKNNFHLNEPTYSELHSWLSDKFLIAEEYEQSDLLAPFEKLCINTLRESWLLKIERLIRRCIRKPLIIAREDSDLVRKTDIFPLIEERRTLCRQFLFIAKKR